MYEMEGEKARKRERGGEKERSGRSRRHVRPAVTAAGRETTMSDEVCNLVLGALEGEGTVVNTGEAAQEWGVCHEEVVEVVKKLVC